MSPVASRAGAGSAWSGRALGGLELHALTQQAYQHQRRESGGHVSRQRHGEPESLHERRRRDYLQQAEHADLPVLALPLSLKKQHDLQVHQRLRDAKNLGLAAKTGELGHQHDDRHGQRDQIRHHAIEVKVPAHVSHPQREPGSGDHQQRQRRALLPHP